MSERYGDCKSCGGRGFRLVKAGETLLTESAIEPIDGMDAVEVVTRARYQKVECAICGATGHCGDAMERRD